MLNNLFLIIAMINFIIISLFLLKKIRHSTENTLLKIVFLFVSIAVLIPVFITFINIKPIPDEDNISEKINKIANNLNETALELSNIQKLLEARIEFVENLKKEAEIAENVISLTEDQVKAVPIKINQELNATNGKNTIISFMINAFFFTLGLIVQPIINFFKQKKTKHNKHEIAIRQYNQEKLLILLNDIKNKLESYDEELPKND